MCNNAFTGKIFQLILIISALPVTDYYPKLLQSILFENIGGIESVSLEQNEPKLMEEGFLIDVNGITSVEEFSQLPANFILQQNYPDTFLKHLQKDSLKQKDILLQYK